MAFTTWAAELQRFKDAIANTPSENLLKSGYTTGTGDAVSFRSFADIDNHLEKLQRLADKESFGTAGKRTVLFPIGYQPPS